MRSGTSLAQGEDVPAMHSPGIVLLRTCQLGNGARQRPCQRQLEEEGTLLMLLLLLLLLLLMVLLLLVCS